MTKPTTSEQALLVFLRLSDDTFGTAEDRERIFELEDQLAAAVKDAAAGEHDGHEFGNGWGVLYLYGPDAKHLAGVAVPLVRRFGPREGSYLVQRYGGTGAREERLTI
jgi:hypothetical protein